MKPLFKIIAFAIVLVGIFSFVRNERKTTNLPLDLQEVNVSDLLSKQKFLECRPDANFMFAVETDIIEKMRGANKVNAKVFIVERATGKKSLLASENIQIQNYEDAISIEALPSIDGFKIYDLSNGDTVIGNADIAPYEFKDLMEYEPIFNNYLKSTNKLLNLERQI